jgi:predicted nuclease with RNAse H fold
MARAPILEKNTCSGMLCGRTFSGVPLPSPVLLCLPPSPPCLGIDLAGLPSNPSGVAVLIDGSLTLLRSACTDAELVAQARACGPATIVAINAPLGLPSGRCCLDDACPCRYDPGTRSRTVERLLARERIPTLATALLKVLARRGIALAARLRAERFCVIEAYPYATLRMLNLPATGKRSRAGRATMLAALAPLVPGLAHPDATEHEVDAVVCALTADLWLRLRCRELGDPLEGTMIVPLPVPTDVYHQPEPRAARAAETQAVYQTEGAPHRANEENSIG